MKSWKTSLGGILTSVGLLIAAGTGVEHQIGVALAAIGAAMTGLSARDAGVSSEQQGIK
jgi:hypothetical protein